MTFTPQEGRALAGYLRSIGQEHAAAEYDRMAEDALQALLEYDRSKERSALENPSGTAIAWIENGRVFRHPAYRHLRNPGRIRECEQMHLRHGPDGMAVAQAHAAWITLQQYKRERTGSQKQTLLGGTLIVIFGGAFVLTAFVMPAAPQGFGTVKLGEGWQSILNVLTLGFGWGLLGMFFWQLILTIGSGKTNKDLAVLIPESDAELAADEEYPQFEFLPLDGGVRKRDLEWIDIPPSVKEALPSQENAPVAGMSDRESYLLYHADLVTGHNQADGVLTVETLEPLRSAWKALLIRLEGNPVSELQYKLPESFIIDHVASRQLATAGLRKAPDVVFFEQRLINPRRMYYLLPHHRALERHPDREIIRLKLLRDCPQALAGDVTTYVRYKMDWAEKREMLAATCRFSRVYMMSCVWEATEGFIGQVMEGMLMAAILTYMSDLGILASYEWITYMIGILFTSTFVSPVLARMIARKVMERRDARMGEKGHEWERKVQNLRVQEDLLKRLKAISWLRAAAAVFYVFLIPGAAFAGVFGSGILLTIASGTLYLGLSLLWFIINDLVETYTSYVYAEVTYGAIGTNLEARARGFTAFEGVTDNFFSVLTTFLSTSGFLLGLSIIGMGWLDLVVPLVLIGTAVYSITGYAVPAMSRDYELSLWIDMTHLVPVRGRFNLGGGVWLEVQARNKRHVGARPFTTKRGQSVLPWLERMDARIIFPSRPGIEQRRNELILHSGQDVATVTLRKSRGALVEGRDYQWDDTSLILAPESAAGSRGIVNFEDYFRSPAITELIWALARWRSLSVVTADEIIRQYLDQRPGGAREAEAARETLETHLEVLVRLGILTKGRRLARRFQRAEYPLLEAIVALDALNGVEIPEEEIPVVKQQVAAMLASAQR